MAKNEIRTVEMTLHIRNAHYALLKDKTCQERIAFYREKARLINAKARIMLRGNMTESTRLTLVW